MLFTPTAISNGRQDSLRVPESAAGILSRACLQATKEHRTILVVFHASWCTDCNSMLKYLTQSDQSSVFSKHFVVTSLDIFERPGKENLENEGGADLYKKWDLEKSGLPAYVTLNDKGLLLSRAFFDFGGGMGWPICPAFADQFCRFLNDKNKHKLSTAELSAITKSIDLLWPSPIQIVRKSQ